MRLQLFTGPVWPSDPLPGPYYVSPGVPVPGPVWPGWPRRPEGLVNPPQPRERHPDPPWPIMEG